MDSFFLCEKEYVIFILLLYELFTPALVDGLLQESEWQQVFLISMTLHYSGISQ